MKIVLINYLNRSGSTLLLSELSKVKNFVCLPESELLVKLLLSKPNQKIRPNSRVIALLDNALKDDPKLSLFPFNESVSNLIESHEKQVTGQIFFFRFIFAAAKQENPLCTHVLFKNTHISFLLKRTPVHLLAQNNVQLFFLLRDPRAIYLSQSTTKGTWLKPMSKNPILTALEWNNLVASSRYYYKVYDRVEILHYEQFVQNPHQFIHSFLKALDEGDNQNYEFESQSNYTSKIPNHLQDIHKNVHKPVDSCFANRWKTELQIRDIELVQLFSNRYMKTQGYQVLGKSIFSSRSIFWIALLFPYALFKMIKNRLFINVP